MCCMKIINHFRDPLVKAVCKKMQGVVDDFATFHVKMNEKKLNKSHEKISAKKRAIP